MDIDSSEVGKDLVIVVRESRIDAAVAVHFKDRMRELTNHPSQRVILDLAEVEFMDSSGLGAVVGAMKQLKPPQKLALANLSPAVEKVFRITRMDHLFPIYPDANAALLDVAHAT